MGSTVLDARFPGWHQIIDTDTLDMGEGEGYKGGCVLCQLDRLASDIGYGDYDSGLDLIVSDVPTVGDEIRHGFYIPLSDARIREGYELLTAAWTDQIERRRAQDAKHVRRNARVQRRARRAIDTSLAQARLRPAA